MALLNLNFMSMYLYGNTEITVILPDVDYTGRPEDFYSSGEKYKVLWLLHGTYGDHTDWLRKSNIELYATEKKLAVVMASGLNSNYSNWPKTMLGYNMYDFLTKELMPLVYGWLPVSDKREDNFIAGLSMGGRGTIKFAVNFPEKFAAAATLSAAPVDFAKLGHGVKRPFLDLDEPRMQSTIENAGGLEAYVNSEENVWRILEGYVRKGRQDELPRLFFACGEADEMIYANFREFREHFDGIGLKAEWFTAPGYKHEWRFWDLAIQKALVFFGL